MFSPEKFYYIYDNLNVPLESQTMKIENATGPDKRALAFSTQTCFKRRKSLTFAPFSDDQKIR